MSKERINASRQIDRLFRWGTFAGMTDPELLERFVAGDDESAALAFAAIVERHGPTVLRVCRMLLHDSHAAEDAFQATFFVLARKARMLHAPELLGNWLYGVAGRTARKAKRFTTRRRRQDAELLAQRRMAFIGPPLEDEKHDLERALHEEIDRLPGAYRAAVIVCYLEGMTQAEAAMRLQLTESTIRGRLARRASYLVSA